MPVYKHQCEGENCGYIFEKIYSIKDNPFLINCPKCGMLTKRIPSSFTFKINGYSEENHYSQPSKNRR